jgi:hypothetical protein
MAEKKASNGGESGLAILIVVVFSLAGGIFAGYTTNGSGFYSGLFLGFLIGTGVLLTVEYASTRIRRA